MKEAQKKVLMIAPTAFFSHRGYHIRMYEEVKYLEARGYRVKTLAYHLGQNITGFDIERIIRVPWYTETGPHISLSKIIPDIFLLIKIFFVIRRFKPDILHCHAHEGALIGIIVNFFFRKKLVIDSQGSLVDALVAYRTIRRRTFLYKLIYKLENFIYGHSDVILASNQHNADIMIDLFKIPKEKIYVVDDGISHVHIDQLLVRELRERFGTSFYKYVLVYCGTMNELEGIDILLQTIAELAKIRHDFLLLLMGFPNVEYYKKKVLDLGIDHHVKVTGPVSYFDLFSYLSLGTCAVSFKIPSSEGNLKLVHYSAIGLPVICFDHAANHYIIGDHAVFLDYKKNPAKLAVDMNVAIDNQGELRRVAQAAQNLIYNKYSNDVLLRELLKAYSYT
ncbi:glycosyltransferase [Candidatus Parcubacteria bacterium]|nr:glycosyltransferase [Candidatus Parcubacteria bacterium]